MSKWIVRESVGSYYLCEADHKGIYRDQLKMMRQSRVQAEIYCSMLNGAEDE